MSKLEKIREKMEKLKELEEKIKLDGFIPHNDNRKISRERARDFFVELHNKFEMDDLADGLNYFNLALRNYDENGNAYIPEEFDYNELSNIFAGLFGYDPVFSDTWDSIFSDISA